MSKSRRATVALQVSLSRRAAPPGSPAPKACADELWATAPAGSRACWAAPPSRRRRARGPPPSPAAARATMARAWRRARRALPETAPPTGLNPRWIRDSGGYGTRRCRLSDAARDGVRVIVRLCRHLRRRRAGGEAHRQGTRGRPKAARASRMASTTGGSEIGAYRRCGEMSRRCGEIWGDMGRLSPTEERRDGLEEAAWVVRHRHRQTGRISRLGLHLAPYPQGLEPSVGSVPWVVRSH